MIEITWLGHGTYQFRLESGEVILVDPWIEGNPAYPQGHRIERVDTILVTHGHFDHIHSVLPLSERFSPQIVAIYETGHWLTKKGAKNVIGMNKGGTVHVGSVAVTMTTAVHSCGITDGDDIIYGGEAAGYVVRFPEINEPPTAPATPTSSPTCNSSSVSITPNSLCCLSATSTP